ncbi:transmembrane protein, putative (macronuclear) [Tetrahymena thermophila SB210]|uniref:Transmembrane protein, putative n=1 Tax=Tetrahymena thermophila (strain SB210) TaxID=312017 RepID=Q22WJ2_TETTS|nr:transmembrane protein, putative [Tetrahymena thermophila SB210]EAR89425.1 transmembrane protein, putative [Tetrahymena thermophila SB210]|eukprot:XP_001009670.1 transmembrane protein, putative [Tetrahymena thermophila SB210]
MKTKFKEAKEWYSKNKIKVETMTYIFQSLLSVATFILSIITFVKTQNTLDQSIKIVDNFQQPYLINFSINSSQCAQSLFDVPWEGIHYGCDCTQSNNPNVKKQMYGDSCWNLHISTTDCKQIMPIFKQRHSFFLFAQDDNKNVVGICAQRASGNNQFYQIIGSQKGTCSQSQKTCGNPNKPETIICVASTDPCPIYSFQITTSIQPQLSANGWSFIKINKNLYFYYDQKGTSANDLPISQIVTTSGPGPCKDSTYQQTKYGQEYILQNWNRPSCDTDTYFTKSSLSITEKQLYQYNLDSDQFQEISNLTGFNLNTSPEIYTTYYKPFIPWAIQNRDEVYNLVNILLNIESFLNIMKIAIIVHGLTLGYITFYVNMYYILALNAYKDQPNNQNFFIFKLCKSASSFLVMSASMAIAIVAFIQSISYKKALDEVCSNSPTLDVYMQDFQNLRDFTDNQIFRQNLTTIITTTVNILIEVIPLIVSCFQCKKTEKSDNKVIPLQQQPNIYNLFGQTDVNKAIQQKHHLNTKHFIHKKKNVPVVKRSPLVNSISETQGQNTPQTGMQNHTSHDFILQQQQIKFNNSPDIQQLRVDNAFVEVNSKFIQ